MFLGIYSLSPPSKNSNSEALAVDVFAYLFIRLFLEKFASFKKSKHGLIMGAMLR